MIGYRKDRFAPTDAKTVAAAERAYEKLFSATAPNRTVITGE